MTRAGSREPAVHVTCLPPEPDLPAAKSLRSGWFLSERRKRTKTSLEITSSVRKHVGEAQVLGWFLLEIQFCLHNLSFTT